MQSKLFTYTSPNILQNWVNTGRKGVNIFSMVTWQGMVFGFQFDVVNFLFFLFLHSRSCLGVAWFFILFCFFNRWFALHKGQFTQVDTSPFFSMAYCVVVKLAEKKGRTSIRITFLFEKKIQNLWFQMIFNLHT